MEIDARIQIFTEIFDKLQSTNSRLAKQFIVNEIDPTLLDDWKCILEVLDGRYPLGYKLYTTNMYTFKEFHTIREIITYLQEPKREGDLSNLNIFNHLCNVAIYADFLEPIVNRTLRLGIGRSLLDKTSTTPMLACKLEDRGIPSETIFVTEKLDGNRCVAAFVNGEWKFLSRNGKEMHVKIDMSGLNEMYIYDGEIMLRRDTELSIRRSNLNDVIEEVPDFNITTGIINRHDTNKDVVYNIFDVIENVPYRERREFLDSLRPTGNVRIVPILAILDNTCDKEYAINRMLDTITNNHGEGLMLNVGSVSYVHKRTNALLKVKKVQTMDMRVIDIEYGNGKYEFCIGALKCEAKSGERTFICDVGTGLSDEQREKWSIDTCQIIGKIVEVAYFGVSQNANLKGSDVYSLRFPRLKRIRDDKDTTSTN